MHVILRSDLEQRVDRFEPRQFMMGKITGVPELMWGTTPLQFAVALGSAELAEMLLRFGANPDAPGPNGRSSDGRVFLDGILGKILAAYFKGQSPPGVPVPMTLQRLHELLATKHDSVDAAAVPACLHVGTHVILQGLNSSPDLNGKRGTLVKLDPETSRWQVHILFCSDGPVPPVPPWPDIHTGILTHSG